MKLGHLFYSFSSNNQLLCQLPLGRPDGLDLLCLRTCGIGSELCVCVKVVLDSHVSHCRAVSLQDCKTGAPPAVVYDSLMGCDADGEGSALGHHPRSTTCFSICHGCPEGVQSTGHRPEQGRGGKQLLESRVRGPCLNLALSPRETLQETSRNTWGDFAEQTGARV